MKGKWEIGHTDCLRIRTPMALFSSVGFITWPVRDSILTTRNKGMARTSKPMAPRSGVKVYICARVMVAGVGPGSGAAGGGSVGMELTVSSRWRFTESVASDISAPRFREFSRSSRRTELSNCHWLRICAAKGWLGFLVKLAMVARVHLQKLQTACSTGGGKCGSFVVWT